MHDTSDGDGTPLPSLHTHGHPHIPHKHVALLCSSQRRAETFYCDQNMQVTRTQPHIKLCRAPVYNPRSRAKFGLSFARHYRRKIKLPGSLKATSPTLTLTYPAGSASHSRMHELRHSCTDLLKDTCGAANSHTDSYYKNICDVACITQQLEWAAVRQSGVRGPAALAGGQVQARGQGADGARCRRAGAARAEGVACSSCTRCRCRCKYMAADRAMAAGTARAAGVRLTHG